MGPNGWAKRPLSEIAEFRNGKSHGNAVASQIGLYPMFGSNGVIGRADRYIYDAPVVVVGRVGAYCGSLHWSSSPSWVTENAIGATAKNGTNPRYLYYLLKALDVPRIAIGSAQPLITQSALNLLQTPVAPPADQRAIASILGALDDKIELNHKMNATLEAMARALFTSWFVDFDPVRAKSERRETGLSPEIADLFPARFKDDSVMGQIPEGWNTQPLADIMTFEGGSQPPASQFLSEQREGYIRLVQIRDFYTDTHLTFVPDTHRLRKFTKDDVMIARYGSSSGASGDSLGRICRGLSGAYNVALVKVIPKRPIREFLNYFLQSPTFQLAISGMGGRSVQSGFRKEDLEVIYVTTGSPAIHSHFEQFGALIWQHIYKSRAENNLLSEIRDALLPKLISGELRVPEAERILEKSA